ncbi:cyclic nucleotide-binding domain-containing protein [Sorangium sp. So ce1000]|uniref:cyclic nucleotide-binding domain-containing protein n=1 Tax=Sorangium sp. So ce1000 TaxID=3133325 RepID=UPI003F63249D
MMVNSTTMSGTQAGAQAPSTEPKDVAELQEVLSISPTFRGLSAQLVDALLRTAKIEHLPADRIVAREGEKAERLYLILKGDVDAFWGEALREVMANLTRGGVFGGGALLGEPNVYSYATDRETLVASWDEDALRRAEFRAPGLRSHLAVRLSKHARTREFAELLQHAPLFRNSSCVLRHRLLQEMTLTQYPSGTHIYREGNPATSAYLIVRGEVEVNQRAHEGQAERVVIVGRGALIGDYDLFASGTHAEAAQAKTDTEVLALDRIDLEALRRACGSFRRAVAARVGSPKVATRPQDLILVVNRTPYATRSIASLIRAAFADAGDRDVGILEVAPEAKPAKDDTLLLPSDPARAMQVLDERARRMGNRQVVVYTEVKNAVDWLAEPLWDTIIDNRISAAVYFTDDVRHTFPIETPQLAPVQYVEVRSSASAKSAPHMVRSGSIRLVADGDRGSELRYESLPLQNRAALQRLARTLSRQSVGVALGGGSAWGFAHVALLRALHEGGIPVDMIAGTSMGSVVACAYGSRGLEGLDTLVKSGMELALRLSVAPITRKPVESLIEKRLLAHTHLQDMPMPTFPVAVDIQTGRARIFRHGRAAHAMFASTALPAIIVPEIQDGVRYVDGGIANNVPVSALVEEGADFIIASNVIPAPSRLARERHKSPVTQILSQLSPLGRLQDALRSMFLLMHEAGTRQAAAAQITFAPSLGEFGLFDFHAAEKIVEQVKPELPRFIELAKEQYSAFCRNRDF